MKLRKEKKMFWWIFINPLLQSMSLNLHVSSEYFDVQPFEYSFLQHRNMCKLSHKPVLGQLESFNPSYDTRSKHEFCQRISVLSCDMSSKPMIDRSFISNIVRNLKHTKLNRNPYSQQISHSNEMPFFKICCKFWNNLTSMLEKLHEYNGIVKIMCTF
jgi:hypothetical protein